MNSAYSGTPLPRKLGYKHGMKVYLEKPPQQFPALLIDLPDGIRFLKRVGKNMDMIHLFCRSSSELKARLPRFRECVAQNGMIWISWPKKSSGVRTDMTEDTIREICLPIGLVDIKVCAVDETWSGLKLVIRKELRAT